MDTPIASSAGQQPPPAVACSALLAVLARNAEAHRTMLLRLADDGFNAPRPDLFARVAALTDLLEIIEASKRECTANAAGERRQE